MDEQDNVREMSASESESFRGVTLDADGEPKKKKTRSRTYGGGSTWLKVLRALVDFPNASLLWKIAIVLGVAALAAFLFFVIVPSLFIILGALGVAWLILRLLR